MTLQNIINIKNIKDLKLGIKYLVDNMNKMSYDAFITYKNTLEYKANCYRIC